MVFVVAEQDLGTSPGAAAVVLASGAGTRVGAGTNKVYLPLAGRPVLHWSLAAFAALPAFATVVLVSRPQDAELAADAAGAVGAETVHGGATRQESELNALRHLAGRIGEGVIDTVLIHDGARPLVDAELVTRVLTAARRHGGAVPGLAADDIAGLGADGRLVDTGPSALVRAQTPQGFCAAELLAVYERAAAEGFAGTDTASCVEEFSAVPVRWVPGDERNLKITYAHDLAVAQALLRGRPAREAPPAAS